MLNPTFLTLFLVVTYMNDDIVRTAPSKTFQRATNRNGTNLCPSGVDDMPYSTIAVDKLDLPQINTVCPPPETRCSWKCAVEPNCSSFSWKANTNLCEFYESGCRTCTVVPNCIHFEVSSHLIKSSIV